MKKFTKIILIAITVAMMLSSCKIKEVIDDLTPETTPSTTTNPISSETPKPEDTFWNVPFTETNDSQDLFEYMEVYLSRYPGRYGMYFTNTKTGENFGVRDNEAYIAADSIALPVNLYLYNMVFQGGISMDAEIELLSNDKAGSTGDISSSEVGSKHSLREISSASLVQNDMSALNMLMRFFSKSKIEEYLNNLGAKSTSLPAYSSPYDMVLFIEEAYRLDKENTEIFSKLIEDLSVSESDGIMVQQLPDDIKTLGETGMYGGIPSYNETAFFTDDGYIVSIFSEGVLKNEAIETIAHAGKAVYGFMIPGVLPVFEYPVNAVIPNRIEEGSRPGSFGYFEEILINSQVQRNYRDTNDISFPNSNDYAGDLGLITFRGNNYRDGGAFGTVDIKEKKLEIVWDFDIGSISTQSGGYWPGIGWTGQPAIVSWSEEVQAVMNIKPEFKGPDLKEVIYGSLDGNIYFCDLETGEWTRDPIHIGYPTKGSVSIDPRGYPLLYTGQGIGENGTDTLVPAYRIFDLTDQSLLFEIGGDDPDSLRDWPNFDSSGILDAENDTFYEAGENGIIYKISLNTEFNAGDISIEPELVKYRYLNPFSERIGIEGSPVIYKNLMYCADNYGMIMCIDLNTFKAIWIANTGDDTDSSIILEETPDGVFIYTGNEVDVSGELDTEHKDEYDSTISKFNALTGELIWHVKYPCKYNSVINGGVLGTPVMGKNDIENLVIFGLAKYGGEFMGKLVALDKKSGEEVWSLDTEAYSWSSPTAVYTPEGKSYILYCNFAGNLYLIDGLTGKIMDVVSLGANIEGTPGVYNDMIVIGSYAKKIFGVRIK